MWIKHKDILYNTDTMTQIKKHKSRIIATFIDGHEEIIGEFWTGLQRDNIFRSIIKALTDNDSFIIIKDTRDGFKKI
ncbi:MAG: hypothetical protein J6Y02_06380 [Pseudobutyrivibrio sp.]|nr:hypothetical protein [Pseudobutyrivibrio sp.]